MKQASLSPLVRGAMVGAFGNGAAGTTSMIAPRPPFALARA